MPKETELAPIAQAYTAAVAVADYLLAQRNAEAIRRVTTGEKQAAVARAMGMSPQNLQHIIRALAKA